MILNISGRTDIVAFYTEWFKKRYEEGYVDVRNPIYKKLVSRIYFKDVDLIIFCTKNPHPIIGYLPKIKVPILFHITLTPYKKEIEPNVPDKKEVIKDIKKISDIIGKENVYVRYDPIFFNTEYTIEYHIKAFEKMCTLLEGYVSKIIVSFIDDYKNVHKNMNILKIKNPNQEDFKKIGINFSNIARLYNITVQTCSEYNNLKEYGFIIGDCLSKEEAYRLTGKNYSKWYSRNNLYCNCVKMVDIGEYNTCRHLCKYCYANFQEEKIKENILKHNPNSSLLIGELNKEDEIKVRTK